MIFDFFLFCTVLFDGVYIITCAVCSSILYVVSVCACVHAVELGAIAEERQSSVGDADQLKRSFSSSR